MGHTFWKLTNILECVVHVNFFETLSCFIREWRLKDLAFSPYTEKKVEAIWEKLLKIIFRTTGRIFSLSFVIKNISLLPLLSMS